MKRTFSFTEIIIVYLFCAGSASSQQQGEIALGGSFGPSGAPGTTYYISNSGNDSWIGTRPDSAWKTISKVNSTSFSAGSQILFMKGNIWREQLTVPSSGSIGNPITFSAYGSGAQPIIDGSNIISGWTADLVMANVYNAAASGANQVFKEGVRLAKGTSKAVLKDHEWYLTGSTLSLRDDSGNPDNQGYVITASNRDNNINENGKSYVTIRGLSLQYANSRGIYFGGAANDVLVDGCTIGYAYFTGLRTWTGYETRNCIMQNCTVNWSGGSGIFIGKTSHDWTVQDNIIHNNSQLMDDAELELSFTGGIYVWCDDGSVKKLTIQRNTVYSNGKLPVGARVTGVRGIGIWLDTVEPGSASDGSLITRNRVYDNRYIGIHLEHSSYHTISYNLVYNNVSSEGIRSGDISGLSESSHNKIYNNVVHGNGGIGIHICGSSAGNPNRSRSNEIKNNICYGNASQQLYADYGGENDGMMGSGNVYSNNSFGVQGSGFIYWGHNVAKNSYSAFEASYGTTTNSVQSDPLVVSTVTPDFRLQSSSPCLNAGTNVGLVSDFVGTPIVGTPEVGAYEVQFSHPPVQVDSLTINVAKPAGMDSAYIGVRVFNAVQSSEGVLHVNGKDSLTLFGSMANPSRHNTVTTFTMTMSAAAWQNGANSLRVVHQSTSGFRIDSIAVTFGKRVITRMGGNGNVVREYELAQNYPNPFNPSTTIRYGLPSTSIVSLTVFSSIGQIAAELVNSIQQSGYHEVTFNASHFASGVYFYRLRAHLLSEDFSGLGSDFVETKKLVLLR